jgi:hypothetical protein
MTTEMLIAILGSTTAVVVSIVTLIATISTNRHSRDTTKSVESLKAELAQRQADHALADNYFQKDIEALDDIIKSVQQVKDAIQIVLESDGAGLSSDRATQYIVTSRENLFASYETHLSHLSKEETGLAHVAKNRALTAQTLVEELYEQHSTDDLRTLKKAELEQVRSNLSESQNRLRDIKLSRLAQRFATLST